MYLCRLVFFMEFPRNTIGIDVYLEHSLAFLTGKGRPHLFGNWCIGNHTITILIFRTQPRRHNWRSNPKIHQGIMKFLQPRMFCMEHILLRGIIRIPISEQFKDSPSPGSDPVKQACRLRILGQGKENHAAENHHGSGLPQGLPGLVRSGANLPPVGFQGSVDLPIAHHRKVRLPGPQHLQDQPNRMLLRQFLFQFHPEHIIQLGRCQLLQGFQKSYIRLLFHSLPPCSFATAQ